MVGENWNVFTKQVLGEKHIIMIMCENPGGGGTGLPLPPSADAYDDSCSYLAC